MHSEHDEAGRPAEWLPFGAGEDVWHHEEAYPPSRTERARRWAMIGGIVFLGLVIAGGGGAFGADAYATHAICAAVGRTGPARTPDGAARNPAVALDKARKTLDDTAALLFFHPQLRDATHGLADDLAEMQLLRDAGGTSKLLVVAASVDTHARQAQTACGLPAQGVLDAAAAPRVAVTTPPAAMHTPPPATLHAVPTAQPSAVSRAPAPRTGTPTADVTSRAGTSRSTGPAGGAAYAAPVHAASAGEMRAAETMVAITERKNRQALVSPTVSAAEREVASYEHAAAEQHLADLRAGTPDVAHHDLDVRGAKARLAAAEEAYRRVMVDPATSPVDRSRARADVEQWNETLTRLRTGR